MYLAIQANVILLLGFRIIGLGGQGYGGQCGCRNLILSGIVCQIWIDCGNMGRCAST